MPPKLMPPPPASAPPSNNQPLSPAHKDILVRHRLSQPTVAALAALPAAAPPDEILAAACRATELTSFPLRPGERALFSHMNGSALWPLAVSHPTQTWEKAFLIAQATAAGGDDWAYAPRIATPARAVLLGERRRIIQTVARALRCAADVAGLARDAIGLRRALELARCLTAGAWEGPDGLELLQVPGVGRKKMETLVAAGVSTVRALAGKEFYHIERLLKRNPPFGQTLLAGLEGFPATGMRARVERWATPEDARAVRGLDGFVSHPRDGDGRRLAIVRVQVWVGNGQAPLWHGQTPWACVAAERGTRPGGHRFGGAGRGGTKPRDTAGRSRLPGATLEKHDGAGELLFFWRCSTKTLLGEGRTLLFATALAPREAFFLWMSCEEVVGTLVETVVTAPAE